MMSKNLVFVSNIKHFAQIYIYLYVSYSWPNGFTEWAYFFEGTLENPGDYIS